MATVPGHGRLWKTIFTQGSKPWQNNTSWCHFRTVSTVGRLIHFDHTSVFIEMFDCPSKICCMRERCFQMKLLVCCCYIWLNTPPGSINLHKKWMWRHGQELRTSDPAVVGRRIWKPDSLKRLKIEPRLQPARWIPIGFRAQSLQTTQSTIIEVLAGWLIWAENWLKLKFSAEKCHVFDRLIQSLSKFEKVRNNNKNIDYHDITSTITTAGQFFKEQEKVEN